MDILKQYAQFKEGRVSLDTLCRDIEKSKDSNGVAQCLSQLIMDYHPGDLVRNHPRLNIMFKTAYKDKKLIPEAAFIYTAFLASGAPMPLNSLMVGEGDAEGMKPVRRPQIRPERALAHRVNPVTSHVWETETQIFLNQVLESLVKAEALPHLYPVLNNWYGEIVRSFRGGKISIDAKMVLTAFLEAQARENSQKPVPPQMKMDSLGHAVWYQTDFGKDLELEYGLNPLEQPVSVKFFRVKPQERPLRNLNKLIRDIRDWLNDDAKPGHYYTASVRAVLHALKMQQRDMGSNDGTEWLYSALHRKGRLLAVNVFQLHNGDWVQWQSVVAPECFSPETLTWQELLTLWQLMVRESHNFPNGRRIVVDTLGFSERARIFNMLYFRSLDEAEGFTPLAEPGDIMGFYRLLLMEKSTDLMKKEMPQLRLRAGAAGLALIFKKPLDLLEAKIQEVQQILHRFTRPSPELRLGSQLALLTAQCHELRELISRNTNPEQFSK